MGQQQEKCSFLTTKSALQAVLCLLVMRHIPSETGKDDWKYGEGWKRNNSNEQKPTKGEMERWRKTENIEAVEFFMANNPKSW